MYKVSIVGFEYKKNANDNQATYATGTPAKSILASLAGDSGHTWLQYDKQQSKIVAHPSDPCPFDKNRGTAIQYNTPSTERPK